MRTSDPLLTGLCCAMAVGCFTSHTLQTIAFLGSVIALLWRVEGQKTLTLLRLPLIEKAILLYVIAFVVSGLMGVDAEASFDYITELKRPLIAFVVASSLQTRRDAFLVAGCSVAAALLSTLVAFKQWVFGGEYDIHHIVNTYAPWMLTTPMGLASTHHDLALLLAQALGLTIIPVLFFWRSLTWRQRCGLAGASLMLAAGVMRTLSRASSLGMLAGLAAAGLALRPKKLLKVILALAILYPLLPAGLTARHTSIFDLSNYSNWFRVRMYEVSMQMAHQYLPWGIGRQNFAKVHERLKKPDEEISPHAHNNYLQLLVEMGWLGLAAMVWFQAGAIAYLFHRVRDPDRYDPPERMLMGGVLMAFVAFAVDGFFHYDWADSLPVGFMWLLVGTAWAVGEKLPRHPEVLK